MEYSLKTLVYVLYTLACIVSVFRCQRSDNKITKQDLRPKLIKVLQEIEQLKRFIRNETIALIRQKAFSRIILDPETLCESVHKCQSLNQEQLEHLRREFDTFREQTKKHLADIKRVLPQFHTKKKSCHELKLENKSLTSGFHQVNIDGELMSVYCDMETDGGGWTMIANITTTRKVEVSEAVSSHINELDHVRTGKYLLSSTALHHLHGKIGFKQFRIYCHKPSSRITIHIMSNIGSNGAAVIKYMTLQTDERPTSCNSYTALPDDNSRLGRHCNIWYENKWFFTSSRLYERSYFIGDLRSNNVNPLIFHECGDKLPSNKAGEWLYYVR